MPLPGRIITGSSRVFINGRPAARRTDAIDPPGAVITGGARTVLLDGPLSAARVGDPYLCPMLEPMGPAMVPHVGGRILPPGSPTVLVEGRPAARKDDPTLCSCAGACGSTRTRNTPHDPSPHDSVCAALWARYRAEAERLIAPVDRDHRERNRVITGAYADLALRNRDFVWAGLAAYASKQVGCALRHAQIQPRVGAAGYSLLPLVPPPVMDLVSRAAALQSTAGQLMYEALGHGNRQLFLDVYPLHRFFEEQGFEAMQRCRGARTPPVSNFTINGFAAAERARRATTAAERAREQALSVQWIAFHEQIHILQQTTYGDSIIQRILDANEIRIPYTRQPLGVGDVGASPASVILGCECEDPTGGRQTHTFYRPGRTQVYDIDQRMDWILHEISRDYLGFQGSDRHRRDLTTLRGRGAAEGAHYPTGAGQP